MALQRPRVLASKAEQRGWCQSRSERGAAGFFLAQWWPWRSNSRRRHLPRVERLTERLRQRAGVSTQAGPWASSSYWHGSLPSASSQRCRCQSRCERRQPEFLVTRWRPGLSRPLRLIANSVERLIASWAQSSSVVSQGFEGDMAAGAAGVGAAGEATQEWRGNHGQKRDMPCKSIRIVTAPDLLSTLQAGPNLDKVGFTVLFSQSKQC